MFTVIYIFSGIPLYYKDYKNLSNGDCWITNEKKNERAQIFRFILILYMLLCTVINILISIIVIIIFKNRNKTNNEYQYLLKLLIKKLAIFPII